MGVMRISAHSLTNDVGIESRSQVLDGKDFKILSRLFLDTDVIEDSVFFIFLFLFSLQKGIPLHSYNKFSRFSSTSNKIFTYILYM